MFMYFNIVKLGIYKEYQNNILLHEGPAINTVQLHTVHITYVCRPDSQK
jgi:hypothetical protein